jgi:hypothetical protein
VACALKLGDPVTYRGESLPTIWLQADLAGVTYPVRIDPTTTITGDASIDDACLSISVPDANIGLGASMLSPAALNSTSVVRLNSVSLIPDGTLTAFRYYAKSFAAAGGCTAYLVKDANTWVEGTKNGAIEIGSCCYNYAKYNSQGWAGSAGCKTSGTDYFADASPPTKSGFVNGLNEWALPVSWPQQWKSGAVVNNGFVLIQVSTGAWLFQNHTTPVGRFEIDYTPVGGMPLSVILGRRL